MPARSAAGDRGWRPGGWRRGRGVGALQRRATVGGEAARSPRSAPPAGGRGLPPAPGVARSSCLASCFLRGDWSFWICSTRSISSRRRIACSAALGSRSASLSFTVRCNRSARSRWRCCVCSRWRSCWRFCSGSFGFSFAAGCALASSVCFFAIFSNSRAAWSCFERDSTCFFSSSSCLRVGHLPRGFGRRAAARLRLVGTEQRPRHVLGGAADRRLRDLLRLRGNRVVRVLQVRLRRVCQLLARLGQLLSLLLRGSSRRCSSIGRGQCP